MKKLVLFLVFMTFVGLSFAQTTRINSYNGITQWKKPSETTWLYTSWQAFPPSSVNDPIPSAQLLRTGARWVKPNLTTSGSVWFRHIFHCDGTGPDYGFRISRATIWISFDKDYSSDYIRIYAKRIGGGYQWISPAMTNGDTLYRWDMTEWLDSQCETGPSDFEILVYNSNNDNSQSVIFYFSFDRIQTSILTINGYTLPRYYLINLPLRFYDSTTLESLMPAINYAWIWNPFTGYYDAVSTTQPLGGALGDKVRTYSLFCEFEAFTSYTLTGYPVMEQRYHDLRRSAWIDDEYPIGGTWSDVPFDWTTGQPDDWYNYVAQTAYIYVVPGGTFVPDPNRILSPGEGHQVVFDNSMTADPDDNNAHLDLRPNLLLSLLEGDLGVVNDEAIIDGPSDEELAELLAHNQTTVDTSSPFVGSYPPSGYDENGHPLPPVISPGDFGKKVAGIPNKFIVSAYPNPFNSVVSIECEVPEDIQDKPAMLKVYDSKGQVVYENMQNTNDGITVFRWNACDMNHCIVPSGLYFYKLSIENYVESGTLCFVR